MVGLNSFFRVFQNFEVLMKRCLGGALPVQALQFTYLKLKLLIYRNRSDKHNLSLIAIRRAKTSVLESYSPLILVLKTIPQSTRLEWGGQRHTTRSSTVSVGTHTAVAVLFHFYGELTAQFIVLFILLHSQVQYFINCSCAHSSFGSDRNDSCIF